MTEVTNRHIRQPLIRFRRDSLRTGVSAGSETDDARVISGVRKSNVRVENFVILGDEDLRVPWVALWRLGKHDTLNGHNLC